MALVSAMPVSQVQGMHDVSALNAPSHKHHSENSVRNEITEFSPSNEVSVLVCACVVVCSSSQCGGKLEASMSGPINEVFARTLRGLSGAKITRPGAFRNAAKDGFAVRCLYKVRV